MKGIYAMLIVFRGFVQTLPIRKGAAAVFDVARWWYVDPTRSGSEASILKRQSEIYQLGSFCNGGFRKK
jgi:hypothetical protein